MPSDVFNPMDDFLKKEEDEEEAALEEIRNSVPEMPSSVQTAFEEVKTAEDSLKEEVSYGQAHPQAGEEDSSEPRYEEEEPFDLSQEEESQEVPTEDLVEQVSQGLRQAAYSDRQIEDGRAFLEKYAIDTSSMTSQDVIEKLRKIQNAKEDQAQVLSRGRVLDGLSRLLSFVPEGFKGGFFGDNDVDVARAKALGWTVFVDEEATRGSSTGSADDVVKLGDQILMIIPEELYIGTLLAKSERIKNRMESRAHQLKQGDHVVSVDPLFPIQEI